MPAVWLVLACFGPDPNSAATTAGRYLASECELQSYALPITLGSAAHVAVCQAFGRPGFTWCNRHAQMVRVADLGPDDWLPGQFYEPSRAVGHWDVLPGLSVSWGRPGPPARSWVRLDEGASVVGFLGALFLVAVAAGVRRLYRREAKGRALSAA